MPSASPKPDSPVFVTTNFSLTYFIVSGEIENCGISAWLVVPECEGMSVLTAWAAGKFSGATIAKFIKETGFEKQVTRRDLVIPGYVAQISGELEENLPGWKVLVGPQEAGDLESFVKSPVEVGFHADGRIPATGGRFPRSSTSRGRAVPARLKGPGMPTLNSVPRAKPSRSSRRPSCWKRPGRPGWRSRSPCGGEGTCGKCIVRVASGEVDSRSLGLLPPAAVAEGYVLACATRILREDLIVEVPEQAALARRQIRSRERNPPGPAGVAAQALGI